MPMELHTHTTHCTAVFRDLKDRRSGYLQVNPRKQALTPTNAWVSHVVPYGLLLTIDSNLQGEVCLSWPTPAPCVVVHSSLSL